MTTRTVPVPEAIASLDTWATTIAQHADAGNVARVNLEIRYALENVQAIAASSQLPPEEAANFRRSTQSLLSVVRPLLRSAADRQACDRLLSMVEGGEQ